MTMELINLTALAKLNHGTTPATRAKLEKLGINPAQEVEMPSGRKFVLFNKVEAVKAIEKARADREQRLSLKASEEATKKAEKPAKAPVAAKRTPKATKQAKQPQSRVSAKQLHKELVEMQKALTAMMEFMTQPQASQPVQQQQA